MSWRDLAECLDKPVEWFFPTSGGNEGRRQYRQGISVCATCPVRAECLAAGKDERYGLWGGKTPDERAGISEVKGQCWVCGKPASRQYCSKECNWRAWYRRNRTGYLRRQRDQYAERKAVAS